MSFNLKNYIKEKYLNERLQSNILINEILYDSGGFFRYYKMAFENSQYKRVSDAINGIKDILLSLFTLKRQNPEPKFGNIALDTDDKIKIIHKKYMEYYNLYMNTVPRLFSKAEPRILAVIMGHLLTDTYMGPVLNQTYIDMYNLTDESFEVYTLSQFKGAKSSPLKESIKPLLNNATCFWVDTNNKLQAISKFGKILLFAPDNDNPKIINRADAYKKKYGPGSTEGLDRLISKEVIEKNQYTYYFKLSDGTMLEFKSPILNLFGSSVLYTKWDKIEEVGFPYIQSHLDLTEMQFEKDHLFDIGNFYNKTSNIQKFTDWGQNNSDKLIIYRPKKGYSDEEGNKSKVIKNVTIEDMPSGNLNWGYNEYKHMRMFNSRRDKQRESGKEQIKSKYKWIRDILGNCIPYAGGKDSPLFTSLEPLSDEDFMKIYGNDTYCSNIAYKNNRHYRYQAAQNRQTPEYIKDSIKKPVNAVLDKLKTYVIDGESFNKKIQQLKGTDKFQELIEAYFIYQQSISYCLGEIGKVQQRCKQYIEIYQSNHIITDSEKANIESTYKEMKATIENVKQFMKESLEELNTKINGKLGD